ncbi:MAG: hypothetical protein ABH854_02925 [Candidatus Diapherotrites archaeon]|nr:hypothetical protein [Candidatus Micrarchaeota archaeon]
MALIISSFDKFSEKFPDAVATETDARVSALKTYFANGGVVNLGKSTGPWPKLIYPDPLRLQQQMKHVNELRSCYRGKKNDWQQKHTDAKTYELRHRAMKFSSPLYWKHVAKTLADPDYREDAKSVSLPVHLVNDIRWRPMVRMFVNDIEYRKQLVETVQNSIVYKDDRRVARYAKELQLFRAGVSEGKLGEIDKKLEQLDTQIKTFQVMEQWARK